MSRAVYPNVLSIKTCLPNALTHVMKYTRPSPGFKATHKLCSERVPGNKAIEQVCALGRVLGSLVSMCQLGKTTWSSLTFKHETSACLPLPTTLYMKTMSKVANIDRVPAYYYLDACILNENVSRK